MPLLIYLSNDIRNISNCLGSGALRGPSHVVFTINCLTDTPTQRTLILKCLVLDPLFFHQPCRSRVLYSGPR